MPLPPNASITDVINKLTELEGINQKTELASVIGSPALSTDTVAQQIVKLQDSKDLLATTLTNSEIPTVNTESIEDMVVKVGQIEPIEVSGTTTSSPNTMNFQYQSGLTTTKYALVVSGLNFKPKKIEIWQTVGVLNRRATFYYDKFGTITNFIFICNMNEGDANYQSNTYLYSLNAYVNETGFRLPVSEGSTSYNWKAYK